MRKVRKDLGQDAIIGAYCHTSSHDGMTAGEAGADYVSFGPVRETGLGTGEPATDDLFQWWSEMVEVPVIAEGALTYERAAELAGIVDFIALGTELADALGVGLHPGAKAVGDIKRAQCHAFF